MAITVSQSERLEVILWILYEEYVGWRPLPSDREAVRHLHLRVPPSLLDVPIKNEVSDMKPKGDRSGLMGLRHLLKGVF